MRTLPILHDVHPMLRERMDEIDLDRLCQPSLIEAAALMERTMLEADGIGLAANQVGLPIRAFSIALESGLVTTLFNPRITNLDAGTTLSEEGCLSFPGLLLKVKRHMGVRIDYRTSTGSAHSMELSGIDAICAQHEIDHLDGIVFTDRVSRLVLKMARRRLARGDG